MNCSELWPLSRVLINPNKFWNNSKLLETRNISLWLTRNTRRLLYSSAGGVSPFRLLLCWCFTCAFLPAPIPTDHSTLHLSSLHSSDSTDRNCNNGTYWTDRSFCERYIDTMLWEWRMNYWKVVCASGKLTGTSWALGPRHSPSEAIVRLFFFGLQHFLLSFFWVHVVGTSIFWLEVATRLRKIGTKYSQKNKFY